MKKKLAWTTALLLPLFLFTSPATAADDVPPPPAVVLTATEVPFEVRIIEDADLPAGVEMITQKGVPGELTSYQAKETVKDSKGALTEVPRLYEEVTLLPVEQVVRRGTNSAVIAGVSDKTKELEAAKVAEAAKAAENARKIATPRPPAALPNISAQSTAGMTSPEENRAYAQSIMSAQDSECFNSIAMRESGWRTDATNPSSGAYGVPQSLPASKMASAGSDWQTNGKTQVNWMVNYINSRYGSPCQAVAFWNNNHWY